MSGLKDKLQKLKFKTVLVQTKYWGKLNSLHKKILCISIIAIITILAITMFMANFKHKHIKVASDYKTNTLATNYSTHKPKIINLAPKVKIDHSKELQDQIKALKSQNHELTQELLKHKDELATKEDINNLVSYINSNNQSIEKSLEVSQQRNIKLYKSLEIKLTAQIGKVISQNPIQINNSDFSLASIIWINGKELLIVHDNSLDENISLTIDETYKGWKLITINNKNCAVFKNTKGVNTQCIH